MENDEKLINDEIDLISLISVIFDNFNLLISIFIASIFVITIYYFSSVNLYSSNTLLDIKEEKSSFLPDSLSSGISNGISGQDRLQSEIEIYKSDNTILDALTKFRSEIDLNEKEIPSVGEIRNNLVLKNSSKTLMQISFISDDKEFTRKFLDALNSEFISDRRDFIKESSSAGRKFIQTEIPRIKSLLKEAEENLNNFKISTNTSDVIFDTNNRNIKLEDLKNRFNEIIFKELELKEFYKENHPIYLTLSEQKNLISSQISEIEKDLPNVPSTQRALENYKREVEMYSNVLRELSSQEISLSMAEASSLSNVRIINNASVATKISPRFVVYIFSIIILFISYGILLLRHFLGDKITNFDSLVDFVTKEKIIGELPEISKTSKTSEDAYSNIADELFNKTIYEITHDNNIGNSFSIISSRKGEGKTEISSRLFNKLKQKHKVCLMDLDFRKKGLTKGIAKEYNFKNFDEFYEQKDKFLSDNGSLFIPSLNVEFPPDFFASSEFKEEIDKLKNEFDFLICDTPPWRLFIDSKIIGKLMDNQIYVVCNQTSSFKDIQLFRKETNNYNGTRFFYNKFKLYFNFFWYKYEYPFYSRNYYYDYSDYSGIRNKFTFRAYAVESITNYYNLFVKWVKNTLKIK